MLSTHLISRLRRTDWDFAGQLSESPFSSIHWHPGRYASQLPAAFIGLLSEPGELVVDPFAGSGTTAVEAQRLDRQCLAIDLNPVACLAARAKTAALPAKKIAAAIRLLIDDAVAILSPQRKTYSLREIEPFLPASVQVEKWYTPKVRFTLGVLWRRIRSYRGIKRNLAQAGFSAVLLPVCRETRHWGYVCDNSEPKDNHAGDVLDEYCRVLGRLRLAYELRDTELTARPDHSAKIAKVSVICGDAREVLAATSANSVDLVVTSPPYFGVSDYIKAQRLSMEWFGFDIEPLRLREIGARSKRHRKTAYREYLSELSAVFREVRRCLRTGRQCVVILGESSARTATVPELRDLLDSTGFRLDLDLNRTVSSQRRQAPSIKGEHVFVLSK